MIEGDAPHASALLEPLDGADGCGADMRTDPSARVLFSRMRDARSEARAEERVADNDPGQAGSVPAQWAVVERLAIESLLSYSKDIEIASWLAESLVRRHGLAGLSSGAAILAGLIRRYWKTGLHPAADPEDPDARTFALAGLSGGERDGSLIQPLRKLALFDRDDGSPIALWQYARSREVAVLPVAARDKQYASGVLPFDKLETTARVSGQAALSATGVTVRTAQAAWRDLESALADVCEASAIPATGRVASLLSAIEQIVSRYVPEPPQEETTAVAAEHAMARSPIGGPGSEAASSGAKSGPGSGPVQPATREELLDEISRIAKLFRDREPNSPMGYTLDEAVRRARLPLADLLKELIPEQPPRNLVLTGLGIRPPSE